jgi:hypothetical protein
MKVKYRVLEERTAEGSWETVGVITNWESEPAHLRLSGIVQHTVSTSIWRVILQRVRERQLTLETYHEAIGEYIEDYRLLPEIYTIEAETAQEIRRELQEQYLYAQQAEVVAT